MPNATTRSLSKMGEKNPNWLGDKASYRAIHKWIRRHKPKPEFCEFCHKKPPFDIANISGKYLRDIKDYLWLCRSCHNLFDLNRDLFISNTIEEIKEQIKQQHKKRDKKNHDIWLKNNPNWSKNYYQTHKDKYTT